MRHLCPNSLDQFDVIIQPVARVYASNNMDLCCPAIFVLIDLLENVFHGVIPCFGRIGRSAVGAETAIENTDICGLDMKIAVVEDGFTARTLFGLCR